MTSPGEGTSSTVRVPPGRDLVLTAAEREDLLSAVAATFPDPDGAGKLLDGIGFPVMGRPQIARDNARQGWAEVFAMLEAGTVTDPYRRLLGTAVRRGKHPALQKLAQQHGIDVEPADSAQSRPTVVTGRLSDPDPTVRTRRYPHLVIRVDPEHRPDAKAELDRFALLPELVWENEDGVSYQLKGSEADLQRYRAAASYPTRVVPAGQNRLLAELPVTGADGRPVVLRDVPVQGLLRDVVRQVLDDPPDWDSLTIERIIDARAVPLEPDGTLFDAGFLDGGTLLLGLRAGSSPPATGDSYDEAFWSSRGVTPVTLIGRGAILADAVSAIESAAGDGTLRLQLVGPEGIGTSAFTRELVRRVRHRFPDGVYLQPGQDDRPPPATGGSYLLVADGATGPLPERLPGLTEQPRVWIATAEAPVWSSPSAVTIRLPVLDVAAATRLWHSSRAAAGRPGDLPPDALLQRGMPAEIETAAALDLSTLAELTPWTAQSALEALYGGLDPTAAAAVRALSASPEAAVPDELAVQLLTEATGSNAAGLLDQLDAAGLLPRVHGQLWLRPLVRDLGLAHLESEDTAGRIAALRDIVRRHGLGRRGVQAEPRISRDYWTTEDRLSYRSYVDAIAAFVLHHQTRPPLTIGIKAPWGAGKTSLMRMLQDRLDPPEPGGGRRAIRLVDSAPAPAGRRGRRERTADQALTTGEVLAAVRDEPPSEQSDDLRAEPDQRSGAWRPTVWFNPWIYQNGEQVWAGLAHEIIEQVTGRLPRAEREQFWLRLNLRRVDRGAVRRQCYRAAAESLVPLLLIWLAGLAAATALLLAGQAVTPLRPVLQQLWASLAGLGTIAALAAGAWRTFTGLRAAAPGSVASLTRPPDVLAAGRGGAFGLLAGRFDDLVPGPGYQGRLGFLHLVHLDIRRVLDLVASENRPLIVFVDDLDRCTAGTVAQVIEAVNLFLAGQFPNCIFVLGMEPEAVAAHVEAAYPGLAKAAGSRGRASLGWRFLDKIVQLPVSLPPPDRARDLPPFLSTLFGGEPVPPVRSPAAARGAGSDPAGPGEEPAGRPDPLTPVATPWPAAPTPSDTVLVDRIARAIRQRRPTSLQLRSIALDVQQDVLGDLDGLHPATEAAADRVFAELYSDADASSAIGDMLPALDSVNPRELKRYINLFRFYSFIVQKRRLRGLPAPTGEQLAKLAVFTIRWPHLVAPLSASRDGVPVLHALELAARAPAEEADQAWTLAVGDLLDGTAAEGSSVPLRTFLASGPELGADAARLL